jgi:hypothetical protein
VSDYVPGRYSGFKNIVYWCATKRRNWWGAVAFVVCVVAAAAAVLLAIAKYGVDSAVPWAVGLGAYGLLGLAVVVLVGLSLHWGFQLIPDEKSPLDSP